MPAITRKVSSQQVAEKLSVEEPSSLQNFKATTKPKKATRIEIDSHEVTNNKTNPTHASSREKSPVIKTPPPQKRSKKNNEDLLLKLAAGEESDLSLQRRFRQSLEDSGKCVDEKLSFSCVTALHSQQWLLILRIYLAPRFNILVSQSQRKWNLHSFLGETPPRSAQRTTDSTHDDRERFQGRTKNGSSISFIRSSRAQETQSSDNESEEPEDNKSQEYPANYAITDDSTNEIRSLNAKILTLMSNYRNLHHKYTILIEKYNKLTKKLACQRASSIGKHGDDFVSYESCEIHHFTKIETVTDAHAYQ